MFVTDGHVMEPTDTVYSGVVSLRNFRLAMIPSELNNLQLWGANGGSVYLQALTKAKLYILSDPELEEFQEHVLVMYKARSGGARQDLEEHVDMTSLLTFFNQWTSCNLHSSGRKGQVSSLPRQRGVTEFSP